MTIDEEKLAAAGTAADGIAAEVVAAELNDAAIMLSTVVHVMSTWRGRVATRATAFGHDGEEMVNRTLYDVGHRLLPEERAELEFLAGALRTTLVGE